MKSTDIAERLPMDRLIEIVATPFVAFAAALHHAAEGVSVPPVTTILALAAFGFSVGLYVGQSQYQGQLALIRNDLAQHERIPIHAGAATSEVVQRLERRVQRLEDRIMNATP